MSVRRIGLLGFDSIQALDLVGPADAFGSDALAAPEYSPNGEPPYEVVIIGLTSTRFAATSGIELHARHVVPTNAPLDTLIVPGGAGLRNGGLADIAAQ